MDQGVETFASWLAKRASGLIAPEPPIPATFNIHVSPVEVDEGGTRLTDDSPVHAPTLAWFMGETIGIRYVDAKGDESERRIAVRALDEIDGDIYIQAYCYERRACRHFWASRIEFAVDLESGEIFDDALAFFRHPRAGDLEGEKALAHARRGVNILAFLAWCDGSYHPDEHEWLMEYIRDRCDYQSFDESLVNGSLKRMRPQQDVFAKAARQLPKRGETEIRKVLRYARRVIDADGILAPEEFDFGRALIGAVERLPKSGS